MSKRSTAVTDEQPTPTHATTALVADTDTQALVAVRLPGGRKWLGSNEPVAECTRHQAATHVLVHNATATPELTDSELRAAAHDAFEILERDRNGRNVEIYMRQFPRRASCYSRVSSLLGVEETRGTEMSITSAALAALRRRLSPTIESTSSDHLQMWLAEHQPPVADVGAEVVRSDTFGDQSDKAARDAVEANQAEAIDKQLDGIPGPYGDPHDGSSLRLKKVEGASRDLAERYFGCRTELDTGKVRTLNEELKRRRPILIRYLQDRYRAGDVPEDITDTITRIRELRLSLIDLKEAEKPLRERAFIAPDEYQSKFEAAQSDTAAAYAEINTLRGDLSRRGWDMAVA